MISVIVPLYNAERFLNKCVESIVNQTYRDLEIILVNDGSQDESLQICKEFASKDSRIIVLSKENGGQMSAWIEGVKNSHGDFLAFVDSDDFLDLSTYEKMISVAKKTNADIVMCGRRVFGKNSCSEDYLLNYKDYYDKNSINEIHSKVFPNLRDSISQSRWDKLFRRELLVSNMNLYCKQLVRTMEDRFIVSSCLLSSNSLAIIHEPLYQCRLINNSSSKKARPELYDIVKLLYRTQQQMLLDKGLEQYRHNLELSNLDFIKIIVVRNICRKNNWSFAEKKQLSYKLLNDKEFKETVLNNKSYCTAKFGKFIYFSYKVNSPKLMTLIAEIYGDFFERGNKDGY